MPNRVGGRCTTDTAGTQGTCGDRAMCSATTGVCQCPQGYQGQPGDTVCMIQAGESCAAPNGDKCVSHAECSAGTCTCSSGYTSNSAGLCAEIPQGKVNAACDATKTCTGTHVVCEQNACKCTAGFSAKKGEDDCGEYCLKLYLLKKFYSP
ncbi:multiple epidermal growth factor-like domains protein 6 [Pomacea canaliculata]|uniref:multiple epidermal growth factor-like domains protein 6 n=1 Tax=Pomacea canaliculata TaxID=400727 RepID=UPI000D7256D4|nr:multiple epidermal growth factor-like domains protein 6 [Pomacea canaliculata]